MTIGNQNGILPFSRVSDATTNIQLIKAGPTHLCYVAAYSTAVNIRYLKFFDKGVAVTLGSGNDLPVQTYAIQSVSGGGKLEMHFSQSTPDVGGVQFFNGLCMAITTDIALTSTSGINASEVVVNIGYQ